MLLQAAAGRSSDEGARVAEPAPAESELDGERGQSEE